MVYTNHGVANLAQCTGATLPSKRVLPTVKIRYLCCDPAKLGTAGDICCCLCCHFDYKPNSDLHSDFTLLHLVSINLTERVNHSYFCFPSSEKVNDHQRITVHFDFSQSTVNFISLHW